MCGGVCCSEDLDGRPLVDERSVTCVVGSVVVWTLMADRWLMRGLLRVWWGLL